MTLAQKTRRSSENLKRVFWERKVNRAKLSSKVCSTLADFKTFSILKNFLISIFYFVFVALTHHFTFLIKKNSCIRSKSSLEIYLSSESLRQGVKIGLTFGRIWDWPGDWTNWTSSLRVPIKIMFSYKNIATDGEFVWSKHRNFRPEQNNNMQSIPDNQMQLYCQHAFTHSSKISWMDPL